MGILANSPTTGSAITGLTSPTYTYVQDKAPNARSSQYVVTALGGTQTGVDVSSVSNPFTATVELPTQFRQLGTANPATGVISNVPMNVSKVRVRKGVEPAADQAIKTAIAELQLKIPAGADENDSASVRAMLSFLSGFLVENLDEIATAILNGYIEE